MYIIKFRTNIGGIKGMERVLEEQLEKIVNLYFKGNTVVQAIEVIRNEAIQTSSRCTRTNGTI